MLSMSTPGSLVGGAALSSAVPLLFCHWPGHMEVGGCGARG